jgi:protein phosphatase
MAGFTDTGMVRPHNEDCILVDAGHGFALLADGLGGYNAGEVASGMVVSLVAEGLRTQTAIDPVGLLKREVAKANAVIFEASLRKPAYAGMGTTLVAAVFSDHRVTVAHVGDSRLYRLRAGRFEQLTRDHSLMQDQIDSGFISRMAARLSPQRSLLTKALGTEPLVAIELGAFDTLPEDLYLLCSDGLTEMLEDKDILRTLAAWQSNLPVAAQRLIQIANENGGLDNVSVILVRVVAPLV